MADTYRIRIRKGDTEIEIEGDKEFVEKHIEEFKEELSQIPEVPLSEGKSISPTIEREEKEQEPKLKDLSLAEFYKIKQPKDHNETVVVFAYWLTKKENKEEFKTGDISKCYDVARITKPKNTTQHIQRAASGKKAWLTTGYKKEYYKLTLTGEELVEKELPHKSEKQ